ncbi:heterodisulfide reductase-related iron-sulfur binding cluster [Limnobacter alexandrii]|jgi:glycerol-3-phosphate dehydrogenase subunit C|uniref:heterodisulfide reductase-related iron-sulfur binding cluster n=1 Tax=Limnobacter alexandrii TaxID=2570352 RepID=UPI001107FDF8|nr:heterodisulfide reductase-related iron-sulfur binding cluster [Limnobacter alexandrii]
MAQTLVHGGVQEVSGNGANWTSPDYLDEQQCLSSMERVFNVCATCRRCLTFCATFPNLFDLIDESEGADVSSVPKSKYLDLSDQCHLCDQCHVGHCPYSAPHTEQINFPGIMQRAKAVKFAQGLVNTSSVIKPHSPITHLAGIPVITAWVNTVVASPVGRKVIERYTGIDSQARLPHLAKRTFRQEQSSLIARGSASASLVQDHGQVPRQVAIFTSCYVNFHEPEVGRDLVDILQHHGIECVLPEVDVCCGRTRLNAGDLAGFAEAAKMSVANLAAHARQGYAIVSPSPLCARIFTHQLPSLFPADENIQMVKQAFWSPSEYLMALHGEGALDTEFNRSLGVVNYHEPFFGGSHLDIARHTEALLGLVPDTQVNVIKGSPGFGGDWGIRRENFPMAMKIGQTVFKRMADNSPDYLSADCQLSGRQIASAIDTLRLFQTPDKKPELAHPLTLLRMAYGL